MVPTLQCGFVRSNFCLAISALFPTLPCGTPPASLTGFGAAACPPSNKALPAFQDRIIRPGPNDGRPDRPSGPVQRPAKDGGTYHTKHSRPRPALRSALRKTPAYSESEWHYHLHLAERLDPSFGGVNAISVD